MSDIGGMSKQTSCQAQLSVFGSSCQAVLDVFGSLCNSFIAVKIYRLTSEHGAQGELL